MNSTEAKFNRQSAGTAPEFNWLVPSKQWFTLGEIAKIINRSESFVAALYQEGRLLSGHSYNAGTGQRKTKRVPRCFFISMLVKTAEYDAETKLQAFLTCLHEFSTDQLRQIATAANCLCARKARETPSVRVERVKR